MVLLAAVDMTIFLVLGGLAPRTHVSDDHRWLLTSTGTVAFLVNSNPKINCKHYIDITTAPRALGGAGSLDDADELGEAFRIGAERGRLAVKDDAALVHDHDARRKGERHAAVLLDEHDRERALPAQA
jgi:hypothetical protein